MTGPDPDPVSEPARHRSEHMLPTEEATRVLAERLARLARAGDVIALSGPLGAGKTVFARAFVQALGKQHGAATDEVPSPTFTLVQTYDLNALTVWHFDLFRLERAEDAWELGIEDAFADGLSLIEWPDRLGTLLPADRLDVMLQPGPKATARTAHLAGGPSWHERLIGVRLV